MGGRACEEGLGSEGRRKGGVHVEGVIKAC